jgi:hypothetical protein
VDSDVLEHVRNTWTARHAIEREASARFKVLGDRLVEAGAPDVISSIAQRAALEESRHQAHCQNVVHRLGGPTLQTAQALIEYAPPFLSAKERLLYEVVAQCCVAETESTTTLVTLMDAVQSPELRPIIQELSRDEVQHARLGWAFLAWCRQEGQDPSFLSRFIPSMVEACGGAQLFKPPAGAADAPELLAHGVVPSSMRLRLYVQTLENVIFPGFEQLGVDPGPAKGWLASRVRSP